MTKRLEVAVGVLERADGRVLLGQRIPGKPYAGWWEFPGGKIEAGESVAQALARELHEELGLRVNASHPWLVREFVYPHAHVRLHFRRLLQAWGDVAGEPQSREGQAFSWQAIDAPTVSPLLPASEPVVAGLRWPALLLPASLSDQELARRQAQAAHGAARPSLPAWHCLRAGDAPAHSMSQAFPRWLARARAQGGRLLVSSALDPAWVAQADGVLLEPTALRALTARPAHPLCAAICEHAADLARAGELGLDAALSPEPDGQAGLPVFRLGADLAWRDAVERGAHGVAWLG